MLVLEFFSWWYGRGWGQLVGVIKRRLNKTLHTFSVPTLLATLFAPWRRIISNPGSGLDAHIRALADNLISRFVGLLVRLVVLFAAGLMLTGVAISGLVGLMLWPLVPPAAVVLLVWGIV
jgi:hypothetical protein